MTVVSALFDHADAAGRDCAHREFVVSRAHLTCVPGTHPEVRRARARLHMRPARRRAEEPVPARRGDPRRKKASLPASGPLRCDCESIPASCLLLSLCSTHWRIPSSILSLTEPQAPYGILRECDSILRVVCRCQKKPDRGEIRLSKPNSPDLWRRSGGGDHLQEGTVSRR